MTLRPDPFEAAYWNLAQVFAWGTLYERDTVARLADTAEGKPSAAYVAVCAALRDDIPDGQREYAVDRILAKLQDGTLVATGTRPGNPDRAEIPRLAWADLRLKFDPDCAMAVNEHGTWENRWERLKFERTQVLALWPEPKVTTIGAPPPDIHWKDLPGWMKHDTWTSAEALLILHGKQPSIPWTTDDEIYAHFLQPLVYLNRAFQSGLIGERRQIDGSMQVIDTPARWYAWAKDKIDVPQVVRGAFLESRYADGPRLHYLHAKGVLSERYGCGPEEIAMWLFFNELIAWTKRDRGAPRFFFSWMPGQDMGYVSTLTDLYFSVKQIEEFIPVDRWLIYPELESRWQQSMTPLEARALMANRIEGGELVAMHPLCGMPALVGPPTLEDCVFRIADIETIDAEIDAPEGRRLSPGVDAFDEPAVNISSVKAQKECREWLTEKMRGGTPEKSKDQYFSEARERFSGLSKRSFISAWQQAIENVGNAAWAKPGRKPKQRIDTPKNS